MPALARDLAALELGTAWLDAESVVIGDDGVPSFNALQNAFDSRSTQHISCFLFDEPYFKERDLREVPLTVRRQLLCQMLKARPQEHLSFSVDFGTDAASVVQAACRLNLEGVIAKRADSHYRIARSSSSWLKLNCQQRQDFVVGGYTDRAEQHALAPDGATAAAASAGRTSSPPAGRRPNAASPAARIKVTHLERRVDASTGLTKLDPFVFSKASPTGCHRTCRWRRERCRKRRWPSDSVKAFSQAIVQHLANTIPARFAAKSGPANRVGKIFVDYLRNGHGATAAAAFSARARPGYFKSRQAPARAMKRLGFKSDRAP